MVFTDIRLQNYRSYKDASFELGPGVTIVVGPNAIGKSNLIEAVLLTANGTGYRGKQNLIMQDAGWGRLDIHTNENGQRTVKLLQDKEKEKEKPELEFLINNKSYKRLPHAQKQPAVLFEPNNLTLFHGEPQNRREYIDVLSSGIAGGFSSTLAKYKKVLAQRNALLKSPHLDNSQLFVWNIRLCELAANIVQQRTETINQILEKLSETYSKISGKKSQLEIKYKTPLNTDNYSASLLKVLETNIELDRIRGFTSSGPHREDFYITLNGEPVSTSASRGETRTLLLALKIIELKLFEQKTGQRPLLLLDDVFSELDGARRKALTEFLEKYQTIITTTDADAVVNNFSTQCDLITLQRS